MMKPVCYVVCVGRSWKISGYTIQILDCEMDIDITKEKARPCNEAQAHQTTTSSNTTQRIYGIKYLCKFQESFGFEMTLYVSCLISIQMFPCPWIERVVV